MVNPEDKKEKKSEGGKNEGVQKKDEKIKKPPVPAEQKAGSKPEKKEEKVHIPAKHTEEKAGGAPKEKEILMEISSESIEKIFRSGTSTVASGLKFFQKGAAKLWEKTKVKTRVPLLHHRAENLLTKLGGEIYDLNVQGKKNVLDNDNVKRIIERIDEINNEIKVIQDKSAKKKGSK